MLSVTKVTTWMLLLMTCLFLASCGDDSEEPCLSPVLCEQGAENTEDNVDDKGDIGTIGDGDSPDPVPDVLSVSIEVDDSLLAAGGVTPITLAVVNQDGVAQIGDLIIEVSSACIQRGLSFISGNLSSSNGGLTVTYTANGCQGNDVLNIRGTFENVVLNSQLALQIEQEAPAALEFVSTLPSVIAIKGSGGIETSTVIFKIKGASGSVIVGQQVDFKIEGEGVELLSTSDLSDNEGNVATIVRSGAKPATAVIVANVGLIEATSSGIVVANGLVRSGGFNIFANKLNPSALGGIADESVELTVTVGDFAGNKVADGTRVNFVTENGVGIVEASCPLVSGQCSSEWKPSGNSTEDGKIKVFATVKGTEDFIDNNSNGVFDDADTFDLNIHDLAESYIDEDNSGQYEAGEYFVDANQNGVFDNQGDGKWNGINCEHSTLCAVDITVIDLVTEMEFVASGSDVYVCDVGDFFEDGVTNADVAGIKIEEIDPNLFRSFTLDVDTSLSLEGLVICDVNGNSLPNGTQIIFDDDDDLSLIGSSFITGTSRFAIPADVDVDSGGNRLPSMAINAFSSPGNFNLIGRITTPTSSTTNKATRLVWDIEFVDPADGVGSRNAVMSALAYPDDDIPELSAGEKADIKIEFFDSIGDRVSGNVEVLSISSACSSQGLAEIDFARFFRAGFVDFTYEASGCVGNDTITATTRYGNDEIISATLTVDILVDSVAEITWLTAEPQNISVAGTGGQESSTVTFRVIGESGGPVVGAPIEFELVSAGGATFKGGSSTDEAISNLEGEVSIVVFAGSTNALPKVIANFRESNIVGTSNSLAIASGLAAADTFGSGLSVFNPPAWNRIQDEALTVMTVAVSDKNGNAVSDNTAVSFITEDSQGIITSSCRTFEGNCSAEWKPNSIQPDDGDITLLAIVKGTEAYVDQNSNGKYDEAEPFTDLGEPYLDANDNGTWDEGEFYKDTNNSNSYTAEGDGAWNGLGCDDLSIVAPATASCNGVEFIDISSSQTFVASGSDIKIIGCPNPINGLPCSDIPPPGTPLTFEQESVYNFNIYLADARDNSLANATNIVAEISFEGELVETGATLIGPNVTGQNRVNPISIKAGEASTGFLKLSVDMPRRNVTFLWPVTVQ